MLSREYYLQEDVVLIAKSLLGKVLCTHIDGYFTSGIISETEAYAGVDDRASHAFGNRRTKRTEIMYARGGCAYVYLCYGIHHLFNIITNRSDVPHAVLIRNIKPVEGFETMIKRRGGKIENILTGPGTLSQAMGITTSLNGTDLCGNTIWIEEGKSIDDQSIEATPRIGVDYAGQNALLPYRFLFRKELKF